MKRLGAAGLAILFLGLPVQADEWELLPGQTSASFAKATGWLLDGTAAMSWPDGRQTLITFWRRCYDESSELCFTQRCTDSFDSDMRSTGGVCHSAK